jgi:D-glycero-alpha-D-manno-heptose-7-phosphate kinase
MRISFGGGGTDLPAYYKRHGGLVVSTTIGYYTYSILTPGPSDGVQIISADYKTLGVRPDNEEGVSEGDLRLPKAITYYFNIRDGLTIFLASQIPPGTGLGSSGSMAVSLIKALAFWCGLDLGPAEVAELACYIEIEKLHLPVGKQDQYAAAFGGLNVITFSREGVTVEPLTMPAEARATLERRLLLFFTGISRQSSSVLQRQQQASEAGDRATLRRLGAIKELGQEMTVVLERGDLQAFGQLLHHSWLEKRQVTEGVTNPFLDECYQTARDQGAVGGKITGAGGGGFLLLYCPEECQAAVTTALQNAGLRRWPLTLEANGVTVMQTIPWQRPHVAYQAPLAVEGLR